MERHILERHFTTRRCGQYFGLCRWFDGGFGFQQLDQALGGAGRALQITQHFTQCTRAAGNSHGVEDEGRQVPGCDIAADDVASRRPHSTTAIAPNTNRMTTEPNMPRAKMRRMATTERAFSTSVPNFATYRGASWVKGLHRANGI